MRQCAADWGIAADSSRLAAHNGDKKSRIQTTGRSPCRVFTAGTITGAPWFRDDALTSSIP